MTDIRELRKRIKEIVKYIWVNEIKNDHYNGMLLREDSLKSSLYFHLRNYLKYEIEHDNVRIYTEYYVKGCNATADIAVALIDNDYKEYHDVKDATHPIAVFELKALSAKIGKKKFQDDIDKVKNIYENAEILNACDFYLCFINEYGDEDQFWVDKRHKKNFKITECTAVYNWETEEMDWDVH